MVCVLVCVSLGLCLCLCIEYDCESESEWNRKRYNGAKEMETFWEMMEWNSNESERIK